VSALRVDASPCECNWVARLLDLNRFDELNEVANTRIGLRLVAVGVGEKDGAPHQHARGAVRADRLGPLDVAATRAAGNVRFRFAIIVRSVGRGSSADATGSLPFPCSPWQTAHDCWKVSLPRSTADSGAKIPKAKIVELASARFVGTHAGGRTPERILTSVRGCDGRRAGGQSRGGRA
jgi:hypothetical protein